MTMYLSDNCLLMVSSVVVLPNRRARLMVKYSPLSMSSAMRFILALVSAI